MFTLKSRTRRAEIRKARPEAPRFDWEKWREEGVLASLAVAFAFFICATSILMYRQEVVPYRPGQWIPHNIVSRVRFSYFDKERLAMKQFEARDREPRVYKPATDVWADLHKALIELPERVANASRELPADLKPILDPGTETVLRRYAASPERERWVRSVDAYVKAVHEYPITAGGKAWPLIILADDDRKEDVKARRDVRIGTEGTIDADRTVAAHSEELRAILQKAADDSNFMLTLQPKVVDFSLAVLKPTHVLDQATTDDAKNEAAALVPQSAGEVTVPINEVFIDKKKAVFDAQDWLKMKAENQKYVSSLRGSNWKGRLGTALLVLMVTVVLSAYVAVHQPKVVRNHARALGIAALLLSMLLLTQMTGLGNGPLYLLGIAPTLLVAMILAIAYEQRFAVGIASMHGMLGTVALQQGVTFFIVIWVGVMTACFFLSDIRTRSKLIEIGGAMALGMMAATVAAGFMGFDPWRFVMQNALYAGAAGLAVGFIVLGILPFIEKAFRITTSMTLLELADASQPLLRRLQVEAPGTYNHSLQVATLAESAAEAIAANSLLCRVGAYYHDVGKIHKADYFVENQGNGENRHLNLNPSVSLLIIIGHVKDGVEMAKEYNLPTSLIPFIQQHHGTTLVEYFYHQACKKEQPDQPAVSEMQYRYPGPKPRTREVAIVMIADACESACRALAEPTAGRVEGLVHDLTMKRLLDGQFDECDITMRELERVERAIVKALIGIYHGRIQYPSTAALMATTPAAPPPAPTAVRSA